MQNINCEIDNFYRGKKVFVTGHTGFKGSWLCKMLLIMGAEVKGYSLLPEEDNNLFKLAGLENHIESAFSDIRTLDSLQHSINKFRPDIVFHLAAQPLVRESYEKPVYTYDVNVMGTVNILEAVRHCDSIKSVVNITTDKVYENKEWLWGYRENEKLNGYDPYSNSKSCSELITETYRRCFLNIPVSTVRAGNVIGGGDFAKDRIIPDCIRAALSMTEKKAIIVRNSQAVRPYQHVLEPLYAYLLVAMEQWKESNLQDAYNVGPNKEDCISTGELVQLFCDKWGEGLIWIDKSEKDPVHEANLLMLDSTKIKMKLNYKQKWNIQEAVDKTVEWAKFYKDGGDVAKCMEEQITTFVC